VSATRAAALSLAACLVIGAAAGTARGQDYKVSAFLQPAEGFTEGQPFQLVIQAEGAASPQMKPPRIPELENLRVLSGPNTNSQFLYSGGKSSSVYQLIYTVSAKGAGPARVPAIEVELDGRTYRTDPIELNVAPAPTGRPSTPRIPQSGSAAPQEESHDLFIEAELGAEAVWVGQPVPLTLTLYTAVQITNLVGRSTPSFGNFWIEDIEVNPEAEAYRTRVGGRPYTAYPIERKLLVAPGPGEFEIEPYVVQVQVRQRRQSLFEMFNLSRGETVVRRTDPLTLRVKPLPGGEPDGFGGAVGKYALRVELDRRQAAVNDAVALRATVEGEGILRAVEAPSFTPPPDVKVFDPKVIESTSSVRGKVVSRKSWEWIIVPLTTGDLSLPELRFPYFDPAEGKYAVASSQPAGLVVERGDDAAQAPAAHGGIQLQRREPAFIKPLRGMLEQEQKRAHRSGLFALLLFLPFVLVPLAILFGRRRERLRTDLGLARARRAGALARKRLKAAARETSGEDSASFHEEVGRSLVEYVADRFNRAAAGMTYELADDLLGSKGVPAELRRRFRSCLESCDFARFVPASGQPERREEILAQARELIEALERAW
jgi:hypothetical protein